MAPKGKVPVWATDPLAGALGAGPASALRTAGRYIGGGLQDFLGSQAVKDSPYAALGSLFAPRVASAQGERQGPYVPDRIKNAPSAPVLPVPITSPNTTFQAADDEYNRLKSQYGGPAGVEQLAMQTSLPVDFTPTGAKGPASLKDFYSAESQVGGRDIESIIGQMGYTGKMAEWAKANPMLAQREYAKKMGEVGYGGYGPGQPVADPALKGTTAAFFPGDQASFSGAANAVPAPPVEQGRAVSAPYDQAQAQAAEKTAGATGMPKFETTPEATPGKQFLGRALGSPWGQALTNTLGSIVIDRLQGIR